MRRTAYVWVGGHALEAALCQACKVLVGAPDGQCIVVYANGEIRQVYAPALRSLS